MLSFSSTFEAILSWEGVHLDMGAILLRFIQKGPPTRLYCDTDQSENWSFTRRLIQTHSLFCVTTIQPNAKV